MSNLIAHRKDIDGLRAISVLAVIIFHLNSSILSGGFVGVDVFFVISGFLITKIIIKESNLNRFSFVGFYSRRIKRIFPALFSVVTVSTIFSCLALSLEDMMWFGHTVQYCVTHISNFLFLKEVDYFAPKLENTPLLHTWSLAVEEQFYLIFPMLLVVSFKIKRYKNLSFYLVLVLTLLSLLFSEYVLGNNARIAFYSLPSRFWEIGMGAVLAFGRIGSSKRIYDELIGLVGILLILGSFVFVENNHFPGFKALFPCVGAFMVILSGDRYQTLTAKLLQNSVLVFVGLISYSLYLWHWPIIVFYKYITFTKSLNFVESISILFSSIVISYISYKYIENPFRTRGGNSKDPIDVLSFYDRLNKFKSIIVAAILMSLFFYMGHSMRTHNGWEWRMVQKGEDAYSNYDEIKDLPKIELLTTIPKCHIYSNATYDEGERLPKDYKDCIVGEYKNGLNVFLYGDSHAAHYSSAVFNWARNNKMSVLSLTSGGCSTFHSKLQYCDHLTSKVDDALRDHYDDIQYIFLALRWDEYNDKEFFKNLRQHLVMYDDKKKIILLGQVPEIPWTSYLRTKRPFLYQVDSMAPRHDISEVNHILHVIAKDYDNVEFFDPTPYFCNKAGCFGTRGGKWLYTDYMHLNTYGGEYISEYFKDW